MIGETGVAGQLARCGFQPIREHCIVPVPTGANDPFALQQYARESEHRPAAAFERLILDGNGIQPPIQLP
jgi:hypothetical protein